MYLDTTNYRKSHIFCNPAIYMNHMNLINPDNCILLLHVLSKMEGLLIF